MGTQQRESLLLNKNSTKYKQKTPLHLIVRGRLFCYAHYRNGGDSEFLKAVDGKKADKVWKLMDELVEAVKILHPRMYTTFIDKVQDI